MKITLLPSTYYTDPTYHRVLSSLKRELTGSGNEVTIVSRKTAAKPELQLKAGPGAADVRLLYGNTGPQLARALGKHLSAGSVLNFHFSGWLRAWHSPLLLAGPPAAARLVVTFQDYRHPDHPPLTAAARRELLAVLRKAYRITAVSGFLARLLRRDFPAVAHKLRVIPNGTDLPARRAPAAPGNGYILTVGRQAPYKGLDLLLFAFAKAAEKGCGEKLVVCGAGGRGPLGRLAEKLGIKERVAFRGLLPPGEVAGLMRGCLFYATTPRWESFGMAALEAMAAGKAVLASDRGGLAEAGRRAGAVLVDPEDTGAVSAALLRLSADAKLRSSLGQKAAASALKYSWTRIAGGYLRSAYR